MGHGIWDIRFGILDLGYGTWDMGFGIWDLGYGIWGMGFGIWGGGCGIWDGGMTNCLYATKPIPKESSIYRKRALFLTCDSKESNTG